METGKNLNDAEMNDILKQQIEATTVLLRSLNEGFSELKYYTEARSIIERYGSVTINTTLANSPEDLVSVIEMLGSLKTDITELSDKFQKEVNAIVELNKSINVILSSIEPIESMVSILQSAWTNAEKTHHIN